MVSEPSLSSNEHTDPSPMAENTPTSVTIVSNPAIAAQNSLTAINATTQLPLKLTPTNYLTWRAQFNALLIGYDLMPYVDGTLS